MRVLAAVAVAVALALPSGSARALAGPRTVRTVGAIEALALEGSVAAYDVRAEGAVRCNRLYVWRLKTGAKSQLGGPLTCRADETSTGRGVVRIALNGSRAAWLVNRGGNTESVDELLTSPLSQRRERRLDRALRTGDVDGGVAGGWLGGLVSDGTTIFVNRWTTALDAGGAQTLASGSLRQVTATGTRRLSSGAGTVVAESASGGRVTVLRADGTVALYRSTGQLERTITPTAPGRAAALSGSRVVVLTDAGTIEVYAAAGGALLKTWRPAARISTRIDLEGRRLAYGAGTRVFVLDVASGRTRALATQRRRIVDVQIEPSGVLYAYNGFSSGRATGNVVFVPASAVS